MLDVTFNQSTNQFEMNSMYGPVTMTHSMPFERFQAISDLEFEVIEKDGTVNRYDARGFKLS